MGVCYMYPVKDSEIWVLPTSTWPNPGVKDSERWVLATYT